MGLKENIKRRRLELDLSLADVAKLLSISKPTLQRYESGVISNIPYDKIERLAEILNTSPIVLMGWENINHKDNQIVLSKEYIDFFKKYNSLDDVGKHTINNILDYEYKRCKQEN